MTAPSTPAVPESVRLRTLALDQYEGSDPASPTGWPANPVLAGITMTQAVLAAVHEQTEVLREVLAALTPPVPPAPPSRDLGVEAPEGATPLENLVVYPDASTPEMRKRTLRGTPFQIAVALLGEAERRGAIPAPWTGGALRRTGDVTITLDVGVAYADVFRRLEHS